CAAGTTSWLSTLIRQRSASGLGTAISTRVTLPCQSMTIHASASLFQPVARHACRSLCTTESACSTFARWIAPLGSRISIVGVRTTYVSTGLAAEDAATTATAQTATENLTRGS